MRKRKRSRKNLSLARDKIAKDLNIIDKNKFAFCWIVDYPMYEFDEIPKKLFLVIIHFQCLKVTLKELNFDNPLEIKAYQYDIVCNGIELSSGAIRNHIPELMYKLFAVAGYTKRCK